MKPLLQIRRLCMDFDTGNFGARKKTRAVDDVDLEVYPSESLGLVGESACGKTTLARCALRLLEPTAGAVYFDDRNLLGLTPAELRLRRREFQMVFQDTLASLDPHLSVGQILSEPFAAHRMGTRSERESWVRALMEAAALEAGLINRRPAQLSGGQQQRVVIARALALRPRLLIADEPVSALDASVQAQILNLLAGMRRQYGPAMILISHSLPVVHYLCSRVAVMYLGRLVEVSSAEVFFSRPRHPYSQALLRSMPTLDSALEGRRPGLQGEVASPAHAPSGCRFHPRCPEAFGLCRTRTPELKTIEGQNQVACFLY
jgi:oligopeptide/dipeptide ABC transporter ATP-binding protein